MPYAGWIIGSAAFSVTAWGVKKLSEALSDTADAVGDNSLKLTAAAAGAAAAWVAVKKWG
tara:strand:+ start:206 stop:385 length:180 start_codon:yes stop_codon:yes gene_type:complete